MASSSDLSAPAPLLGHEHAREILARAAALDQPAQGYVFCGPESVGKRTVALWLAARLNCRGFADARPCGSCLDCKKVAAGSHPDLVEVAVGPKRATIGVDQIRTLQQSASFGASEGRWKIFLIPEAHRMTDQAANCLLKSLEEPRPGQVFILCAISHTALLPTILSRCQLIRFSPVMRERIASWLRGLGIDGEKADRAGAIAGGRPGLARRLAQDSRAWALREKVLAAAAGLAHADAFDAMQAAEALEPTRGTADEKRAIHERNFDVLLAWFRDLICLQNGLDASVLNNRDREEDLRGSVPAYSAKRLQEAVAALQAARVQMARYANAKLVYARLMLSLRADVKPGTVT